MTEKIKRPRKRTEARKAYERMYRARHREKIAKYASDYYHRRYSTDPLWRARRLEYGRDGRRKAKYGITREQFLIVLDQQKGTCLICEQVVGEALRVDHDHDTGEVRALLCANCNAGLGMFGESPERLEAAAKYIRNFKKGS